MEEGEEVKVPDEEEDAISESTTVQTPKAVVEPDKTTKNVSSPSKTIELAAAANETEEVSSEEAIAKNADEEISSVSDGAKINEGDAPSEIPDSATATSSGDKSTIDDHAAHTRYEGEECIYTNPDTKQEYSWSKEMSQWVPRGYKPVFDGTTYKYTDASGVTFKWDVEKSKWEETDEPVETAKVYGFDGENHTYTDPKDNTVYIWDREKNAWFPKVDDDFMARYQMNYGFVDNTTKEEEKPAEEKKAEKRKASEPAWFEIDDTQNTKVYVSNLPEMTEQEFVDLMQKCGLVLKDMKTNKYKIKLYREPDGTLKGDGLCDYIKIESVQLALNMLDGSDVKGKKIKVQRAKFQMKGDYDPSKKPKKKKKKEVEKEKKMQQKLLDWRPDKLRGEREKHERTVVIKNLFTPATFDENVELILEYTEDIRSEASKCGTIRKVTLYDKNPEGVATVTFSDAEEADICIKLLNNRWFGKRKIMVEQWDGKAKFKVAESESENRARLDNWNKFLESEDRVKS